MGSLINYLRSLIATPILSPLCKDGYKMVIAVRTDIPMGKGKIGAQCAHAALECYRLALAGNGNKELFDVWIRLGQPKIVLRISGENQLLNLAREAKKAGLFVAIIRDAGRTQLEPGTISVLGIGPGSKTIIDSLTSDLKLL